MERNAFEDTDEAIKNLTKNYDCSCPDLGYTFEQVSNDKKAQEYFKIWKNGIYSLSSLTTFINARCSYLYSKTTAGKRAINNRLDLLNYLYEKEPTFKEELYQAREKLDLGDNFEKTEFTSWSEAYNAINEQYANTNNGEAGDGYPKRIAEVAMAIRKKFNLSDEWYDVLLCQIASPEVQQRTMVKRMQLAQKISVTEVYGNTLTIRCFATEINNSDIKVIAETLKNIPNILKRSEFTDINDMIANDRNNGLSWQQLSKKYGILEDNIRQKIYYDSKNN